MNCRRLCIPLSAMVAGASATVAPLCSLSQNSQITPSPKKAAANSASSTPAVTAKELYTVTLAALLLDHDQQKAAKGFLHVVQIDPHFAAAWFNLGVIAESEKSWIQAENYFRKYLVHAPNGPDAHRAKDQLTLLPKYASGEITPEAAKSAQYDALIQRSRVFLAAGHFREAIAEAGRAQAIDDSRWEAYAVVSLCMARQNKTQEAVQFASLAIDHAPADKRDQVRTALASSGSPASIPISSTRTQDLVPEQSGAVSSALTPQVNLERNEAITRNAATVESPVAILHVFRNMPSGWDKFPIRIDGTSWFTLENKHSYLLKLPAGAHVVSAGDQGFFSPSSTSIEVSPKGEYWLRVSYNLGWSHAKISFALLSSEGAAKQMQGTQETTIDSPTLAAHDQH
jgi:tetratricopeptide (TPR) repeat protein